MSQADTLLKKASAFERLAMYSDRKSFLQAIAQDAQPFPPASNLGSNAPYVPGTEPSVGPFASTQAPKPNKYLPGPGFENVPEQSMDRPVPVPPPPQGSESIDWHQFVPARTGEDVPSATPDNAPTAKNYGDSKTVKMLQTFLASSLGSMDVLGPKGIDGRLGPGTISALQQWGRQNGVKTTDITELLNIALNKSGYRK